MQLHDPNELGAANAIEFLSPQTKHYPRLQPSKQIEIVLIKIYEGLGAFLFCH